MKKNVGLSELANSATKAVRVVKEETMKHCLFKSSYTKITVIILLVLVVFTVIMGCSSPMTTNNDREFVMGTLYLMSYLSEDDFDDFIHSYEKYEMRVLSREIRWPYDFIRISYNQIFIEEQSLLELLENDHRVHWVSKFPDWTQGEMTVHLLEKVDKENLEDFLQDYSEYELKILFYDRIRNRIRISFDHKAIDEYDFMRILGADSRVKHSNFRESLPDWDQGKLIIVFKNSDENVDEFVKTYSDYEMKLLNHFPEIKMAFFSFNHYIVDEFDLYDMVKDDPRVLEIWFSYIEDPDYK